MHYTQQRIGRVGIHTVKTATQISPWMDEYYSDNRRYTIVVHRALPLYLASMHNCGVSSIQGTFRIHRTHQTHRTPRHIKRILLPDTPNTAYALDIPCFGGVAALTCISVYPRFLAADTKPVPLRPVTQCRGRRGARQAGPSMRNI